MNSSTYTPEMRQMRFNTVYIIESLPKGESKTGRELYQQLKFKSFQDERLHARYEEIQTRKSFIKLLHRAEEHVTKGFMPWLHLEIHGNRRGLTFASGDVLEWEALHQHLRRLNKVTSNNLMVSFATCRAAKTYLHIDPTLPAPFIGVIAPADNVSVEEVEEGFSDFFNELFTSCDISNAVDALNQGLVTPRFQFLYAEGFFDMLWDMLEDLYTNSLTSQQRIQETISQARHYPNMQNSYSLPVLLYRIAKFLNPSARQATRQQHLRTFMMLD